MKIIEQNFLTKNLVEHPYDTNKDYFAKVNVFYISKDEKFIAAYWEAPEGWFSAKIDNFYEINYVIEGEVEFILRDKTIKAKKGDCFLLEDGDEVRWNIKKFTRTVFFIYPSTTELTKLLYDMMNR